MPTQILIIQGHPDPAKERFCQAIAERYAKGARSAGHQVDSLRPSDASIPQLRTRADFYDARPPSEIEPAIKALKACDHLVIIFPLWLGGMPAFTRSYFEQLLRPGVALEERSTGFPKALLKGRSAHVIVTMGMPGAAYRWVYGGYSVRGFVRSALKFSGLSQVRTSYCGMVESKSAGKLEKDLSTFERLGRSAR